MLPDRRGHIVYFYTLESFSWRSDRFKVKRTLIKLSYEEDRRQIIYRYDGYLDFLYLGYVSMYVMYVCV